LTGVVALIPARSGSKGLADKNVRDLGGRPLMAWTIAACRRAGRIDRVVVSTDSEEYAAIAEAHGAEVPFLRPPEISGGRSTDREFVVHALDELAGVGSEPDLVVHMRPTTPFRDPDLVDRAIEAFASPGGSVRPTALRSVHATPESAWKCLEIGGDGMLRRMGVEDSDLDASNVARQEFPPTYVANGYVDVLSTAFIRESGLLHGSRVLPFETPQVIEVDDLYEFELLEAQLAVDVGLATTVFGIDG